MGCLGFNPGDVRLAHHEQADNDFCICVEAFAFGLTLLGYCKKKKMLEMLWSEQSEA